VPRHVVSWERSGYRDKLFRGTWHVGHELM
jgi:hypothetical protein